MSEQGQILFGACYYPEHWPETRWRHDADMMREAGFNVVRMAEFAWMKLERKEGEFDFSWLDRAIETMSGCGIRAILGTPTANPPKWLMDKHPDIYQRDERGLVKGFGTRRHYCYDNERYRHYVELIVTAMAEHYKEHPDVIGWQIDNELGAINTTRCFNEETKVKFQWWLKDRYQHIDTLNEAWGTMFSSQTYNSWSEIHLPGYSSHMAHNPGLALDFNRYSSGAVRSFQRLQVDILKRICPDHPVSTNMMGEFNEIDYYDLSADLDIASLDIYPNLARDKISLSASAALQYDITRGLKKKNYWVTELQSGTPGGIVLANTPRPGELRRWTHQALAHGGDALIYFRWRTLPFGLEQLWHGILYHHGEPGRLYDEVKQTGEEIGRIADLIAGSENRPKVAMIRCFHNEWALEFQPHAEGYRYMDHFKTYYAYFHARSIETDIVQPGTPLDGYKLVVIPNWMMSSDEHAEQIYDYVRSGGRVLLDFRAGAKTWDNRMQTERLPGKFRRLLGMSISEYGVIASGEHRAMTWAEEKSPILDGESQEYKALTWFDVIELEGAEPVLSFAEDYFSGKPAVTRHDFGQGTAYYCGTEPDERTLWTFMDQICVEAGIHHRFPDAGSGLEVVTRMKDGVPLIWLINHDAEETSIKAHLAYRDLLTGRLYEDTILIEGNGVAVLIEA